MVEDVGMGMCVVDVVWWVCGVWCVMCDLERLTGLTFFGVYLEQN